MLQRFLAIILHAYFSVISFLAMLGVISIKLAGAKLEWDAQNMQFTNCSEANQYVNPPYRAGWTL